MREIALGIGDLVDVEEDGARDVLLQIFGIGVTSLARHVPGSVDNDDVGRVEFAGKLLGLG